MTFNAPQQAQINLGKEQGLDVSKYAKKSFSDAKMEQMRLAQLHHVYDKLKPFLDQYDVNQLKQIRLGLEKGLAVEIYANETFNWMQMEEIRRGLEQGLPVEIYAKETLNWTQMTDIRFYLSKQFQPIFIPHPTIMDDVLRITRIKNHIQTLSAI